MRSTSLGVVKAGNLKLDFMAESIGIHFFEFEDKFRCYRDNENLKKHFGHMDTLNTKTIQVRNRNKCKNKNKNIKKTYERNCSESCPSMRVSMGLTVNRQIAKKLTVYRQ